MPRKSHEPNKTTKAEVSALASFGLPHADIAVYLDIDPKTLRKHYRHELDTAELTANARVGKFLFKSASGLALKEGATHADCIRAAMFWAKTRMRWRETHVHELTGPGGGPVRTINSEMSAEEAAEAYAASLNDSGS
jgi:hypothetical protein